LLQLLLQNTGDSIGLEVSKKSMHLLATQILQGNSPRAPSIPFIDKATKFPSPPTSQSYQDFALCLHQLQPISNEPGKKYHSDNRPLHKTKYIISCVFPTSTAIITTTDTINNTITR
jgi:hypothetical protein